MGEPKKVFDSKHVKSTPYAGRWVALLRDRVVGQGGTPSQALQAAKAARPKEVPKVIYVPTASPFQFSHIFDLVCAALPPDIPVYLVGGALRDALLSGSSHDFDFVLQGDALRVARQVANRIDAAYYPLDKERGTARVIYASEDGLQHVLDFATLRGGDLEADLKGRDFTINAMAVDVRQPQSLLDPLGGIADLQSKIIRSCTPTSFDDDPVRVLRAVRFAGKLGFRILPETRAQMRSAISELVHISPERLRDELFEICSGPKVAASIQALDMLGALSLVLPELSSLKDVAQSKPHVKDVWGHSLDTVSSLEKLLHVLDAAHDSNASANLFLGLTTLRLGRYREHIQQYLAMPLTNERSLRSLLIFAALYHDIGKPESKQETDDTERIRFLQHEHIGARIVAVRGAALHLSNAENDWLESVTKHHMRPAWLARESKGPSRRSIYRFFRDTGAAGVAVCLLSLADLLATYGTTLPQERWARQLDVVRSLLQAWWESHEEQINPPSLLSGHDVMQEFQLTSGPLIGEILDALREAQAIGQLTDRDAAINYVGEYLLEK